LQTLGRKLITATQLNKSFLKNNILVKAYENINFEISAGEFVCIVGPSGCGKTTLLRTIAGLDKQTQGELNFATNKKNEKKIGMVFQEHGLFPWMSVFNNILFILKNNSSLSSDKQIEITNQYIHIMGLSDFAHYYPSEISGGMRQRVSIARCFAIDPDLLLMDEPFVFLDYQTRMQLHNLLLSIWRDSGKTVLFVTHDIEEAVLLADRILVMNHQPGTIEQEITIDLARPRDAILTRKESNFFPLVTQVLDLLYGSNTDHAHV